MHALRMVALALMTMALGADTAGAATVSETTSYQADAGHSGGVADPALDGPLQVLWTQPLQKGLTYPLVAGGRVFVISPTNPNGGPVREVTALDAPTGRVLWRRALQAATDLTYGDGMVYALNQHGLVVALDPATGVTRWAGGPPSLGINAVYAPPVFHDGAIYYNGLTNDEGATVVALDGLTGAMRWHVPLATQDANAGVAADDQGLYLGNECGFGISFAFDGASRWSTRTPCAESGPGFGEQTVVADGRVFTDFNSGAVLDATTGAIVDGFVRPWRSTLPAFGAGHVAVLSDGVLTISDRAALTTVGTYVADDPDRSLLLGQPFFVDGRVFSVDNRQHLIGVDAATATLSADVDLNSQLPGTWDDPPAPNGGGIAVGSGVMAIATTSGRIVAVTGPGGPTPLPPVDVPPPAGAGGGGDVPPATELPPAPDPTPAAPAPVTPTRSPSGTPARAASATGAAAARGVTFPAGAKLRLVRRGLTLAIAGAHRGATVDAILRARGHVVWRAHARVPRNGRVRLAKAGHAITATSAQLEIRVRAKHATTFVVRRTLR